MVERTAARVIAAVVRGAQRERDGSPSITLQPTLRTVQAYIAALPGWKRDLGKRLDTLIVRTVPNVRKA